MGYTFIGYSFVGLTKYKIIKNMSTSTLIVEVKEGKLKGKLSKTVNNVEFCVFKGIPYAKAPVGELRFSVPQSPEPWEGVRDATADCNICAQFDKDDHSIRGEEDCLYLNVYTRALPSTGSKLLPVMVFIHGGGFLFGHGTDDSAHGPDYLIEKDVVVVGFNYRVGILGFLSLNCKDAPGNMGLRDQVQALKWIKENISIFGGDPNNVVLFGFSAGAASVEYLLLSPLARGLFHKAIAHSGSSLLNWARNDNISDLAVKISGLKGKVITDKEKLLKFLKYLPVKELVLKSVTVLTAEKTTGGVHFGFVPTVEKPGDWEPFLDKCPYKMLSQGEFAKVPYLTGFCTREGLLMASHMPAALEKLTIEKDFTQYLPFDLDETQKIEIQNKFKTVYLESKKVYKETDGFAIDFFTDVDFLGGIFTAMKLIAKNNSPVYFYEFTYDGALNYLKNKLNLTEREGACHGDDGGYLIRSKLLPSNVSDSDKLVRERMLEMWTNFANYGDPTPKTDNLIPIKWEPISETGIACMKIGETLSMQYEVYPERTKLFEELYRTFDSKQ